VPAVSMKKTTIGGENKKEEDFLESQQRKQRERQNELEKMRKLWTLWREYIFS
jgi:hypothetical protein